MTRISWYHSPIDKTVLRELATRQNLRPLIHMLGHLLLVAATGAATYLTALYLPWPVLIPMIIIHGTGYTFLGAGGAGHELSHRTVFKSKWLNEVFMVLTAFMSYFTFIGFRRSHKRHHQLTVHEGEDMEVILPMNYKPINWLWVFSINVPGMAGLFARLSRQAVGIFKSEWEQIILPESDVKGRRKAVWWARIVLAGHLVLAATFVLSGNWVLLFVVTFAPFIGNWLNYLTGAPQHAGLHPNVPDFRVCCRTMILGPIPRFLYWNMNYHVEHHMFAGVPFYNLPRLHKSIESDQPLPKQGLLDTWREMIPVLKRQWTEPDHVIMPVFPESATPPVMGATTTAIAN